MAKPKMSLNLNLNGLNNDSGLKNTVVQTIQNIEQKDKSSHLSEPRTYKRISYKKIYSSKLNDYPIDNIPEAEGLLLMYGLLEPFSVNYDEDVDMYELESGDRRFHALQNLFDRYENNDEESPEQKLYMQNVHCLYTEGIYCMVENGSRDRDSVRERIIAHNETNRPFDAMRTSSRISELADIYTRRNQLLPSHDRFNVNEKIAEILKNKYTVRQIIRYKNFDKLTDELKHIIIKHDMSVSEISTYHSLTEEEQSVLAKYIDMYHENGKKLELPTMDEIRNIVSSIIIHQPQIEDDKTVQQELLLDSLDSLTSDIMSLPEEVLKDEKTITPAPESKAMDKNNLEQLKAVAAQKIKEGRSKKDKKIADAMLAIQKKSLSLEKTLYAYIDEETDELQLDIPQLINDIDSTISTLMSIKNSLKTE